MGKVVRRRLVVKGRVQGVGFRFYTKKQADRLGVCGSVKNLPNGDVEIEAEAELDVLDLFCDAIRIGPSASIVQELVVQNMPVGQQSDFFEIRMF